MLKRVFDKSQVPQLTWKTIEDCFKKCGSDGVAMLLKYVYHANIQGTNQIKANIPFMMNAKCLGWGRDKTRAVRDSLVKENFVELINGGNGVWYTKINHLVTSKKMALLNFSTTENQYDCEEVSPTEKATLLKNQHKCLKDNKDTKCLKNNNFPKIANISISQGESLDYHETKVITTPATAKRLFPIPDTLTLEQKNWLDFEGNLPELSSWWTDEVYPAFKAYCISKNRTFKEESNFLGGCLEYGLNRWSMGVGVSDKSKHIGSLKEE